MQNTQQTGSVMYPQQRSTFLKASVCSIGVYCFLFLDQNLIPQNYKYGLKKLLFCLSEPVDPF
jgi:hypothetical protein